jgi:hypothetical protein
MLKPRAILLGKLAITAAAIWYLLAKVDLSTVLDLAIGISPARLGPASAGLFSSGARNQRSHCFVQKMEIDRCDLLENPPSPVGRGTSRLMLPRGQDFESAVAEFDHVFSRIPRQVRTGQDGGRTYVQQSAGRGVLERLAGDASAATPSAREGLINPRLSGNRLMSALPRGKADMG